MTEEETTAPAVLRYRWPNRWQSRVDVCAVLIDHAVRWVIRDLLEAAEGDAGDFADDPEHAPAVEHATAHTWTLDEARRALPNDMRGLGLIHWMTERERSLHEVGYGNVVRLATPAPASADEQLYSVHRAAELLEEDGRISTGQRRLFAWLLHHGWIVRRGQEYIPAQSAVDAGLLAVVPRRLPHNGDLYPQVVVTTTGLDELHAALTGPRTPLDQES